MSKILPPVVKECDCEGFEVCDICLPTEKNEAIDRARKYFETTDRAAAYAGNGVSRAELSGLKSLYEAALNITLDAGKAQGRAEALEEIEELAYSLPTTDGVAVYLNRPFAELSNAHLAQTEKRKAGEP